MVPSQRIDQTLALAALALIIIGCFLVLRPFLTAVLWAMILAVTLWPLQTRLAARMRPSLAALVTVLLVTVFLLAPFAIVFSEAADNSARVAAWMKEALQAGPPDPPAWVARLP